MDIKKELFKYQDLKYRDFHSSLVPNISKDRFIGARTPILRKIAKDMIKDGSYKDFIKDLPHYYYEEKKQQESITGLVHNEIKEQYAESKKALVKTDEFKKLADEITRRSAEAELGKDMLDILDQEQKNALAKYVLECEKKKLDFNLKML